MILGCRWALVMGVVSLAALAGACGGGAEGSGDAALGDGGAGGDAGRTGDGGATRDGGADGGGSAVFASISSGWNFSCALDSAGRARCWGDNQHGAASPPAETFRVLHGGATHACGVTMDARVVCWG